LCYFSAQVCIDLTFVNTLYKLCIYAAIPCSRVSSPRISRKLGWSIDTITKVKKF
jgi:hypothetical protein